MSKVQQTLGALSAGDKVENLTLVEKLGQGSSGFVWEAKDENGQEVVIKLVPLVGWRKEEYERESQAFKMLVHPNILKLHKNFETNNGTAGVLVIEKLDCDLLEFLDHYQINEGEAKLIFSQILEGVNHCHNNSCAHMDLKPENILIRGSKRVKIADLGSTYFWGKDPLRTGKAGTSFYCAPEVKNGCSYRADKADIWSLGISLHVILTGFWPYLGQSEKEVLEYAKVGKIDLAKQMLSPSVCEFLGLMLQLNPEDRPPISELLKHEWLKEAELEQLIFTPRELTPFRIQSRLSDPLTQNGQENEAVLADLTTEGLKTPRKCQMFSPRVGNMNLAGIGHTLEDEMGIRPSPRGDIQKTRPTKLRKLLLNFRKKLDKSAKN